MKSMIFYFIYFLIEFPKNKANVFQVLVANKHLFLVITVFCRNLGKHGTNKQSENDFRAVVIVIDV